MANGMWGEQSRTGCKNQAIRPSPYLTNPAEDKRKDKDKTPVSAIGEHLVKNLECPDSLYCIVLFVVSPTGLESLVTGISNNDKEHNLRRKAHIG